MSTVQGVAKQEAVVKGNGAAGANKAQAVSSPPPSHPGAIVQNLAQSHTQTQSQIQDQADIAKALAEAIKRQNKELKDKKSKVTVSVDNIAGRYILRYKDTKSGKTVQQLPPEGILKMLRTLNVEGKGLVLDSKG